MQVVKSYPNIKLYLPESFEWLVLKSGLLPDGNTSKFLEHPWEQIESSEYFSWERYFTALLIQYTQDTYLKYSKKQLNPVYMQEKSINKILAVVKGIDLG